MSVHADADTHCHKLTLLSNAFMSEVVTIFFFLSSFLYYINISIKITRKQFKINHLVHKDLLMLWILKWSEHDYRTDRDEILYWHRFKSEKNIRYFLSRKDIYFPQAHDKRIHRRLSCGQQLFGVWIVWNPEK